MVTMSTALVLLLIVAAIVGLAVLMRAVTRNHRNFGSAAEQAAYQTLHTASLAAPALRGGLSEQSAGRAARHFRALLDVTAVSITDGERLLAWDGRGESHASEVMTFADNALHTGRTQVLEPDQTGCADATCPILHAVIAPLTVEGRVVGTIGAYGVTATAALIRAVTEVGRWASTQLELAELDRSRTRLAEAQVRALRAQISPHFIYNSLTTIASFVRTNPERARDLLLEFADFTRYSFRTRGDFTTLADELMAIERYVALEQARFGDRLLVTLQIAPEVLGVALPFLSLQPLVENAVRHGLDGENGIGHLSVVATDMGQECVISVEDDGVGMAPELVRQALAGEPSGDSIGLANVNERMRQVYGDEFGLVVETAPGAGTKVILHLPKFKAGVRAS
jgi:two-component system LytT family sensor kinase